MTKLKWIPIAIGVLVVLVVAWWLAGKVGLLAGGGVLALLGIGSRKSVDSKEAIKQALDDGLEAKEAQVKAEREEMKEHAAADIGASASELEERANAVDPDSVPWRRQRRDN